jgi:predicted transcriptional regulator
MRLYVRNVDPHSVEPAALQSGRHAPWIKALGGFKVSKSGRRGCLCQPEGWVLAVADPPLAVFAVSRSGTRYLTFDFIAGVRDGGAWMETHAERLHPLWPEMLLWPYPTTVVVERRNGAYVLYGVMKYPDGSPVCPPAAGGVNLYAELDFTAKELYIIDVRSTCAPKPLPVDRVVGTYTTRSFEPDGSTAVRLDGDTAERLRRIAEELGADSPAEAVKYLIELYMRSREEPRRGGEDGEDGAGEEEADGELASEGGVEEG